MKQKFGNTAGTIVHTVFYSVVPIVAGIFFFSLFRAARDFHCLSD